MRAFASDRIGCLCIFSAGSRHGTIGRGSLAIYDYFFRPDLFTLFPHSLAMPVVNANARCCVW
jgi:hypothetical protein